MDQLECRINVIGDSIRACIDTCELPRGLVFEGEGRDRTKSGVVIVGLTPGTAKKNQRISITNSRNGGLPINQAWIEYIKSKNWKNGPIFKAHPYYLQLRKLVDQLGFKGPIIWTELVKCEGRLNLSDTQALERLRTCSSNYLFRELEGVDSHWPLIGVGRVSFFTLSILFPNRKTIFGVPHPTGRGNKHFQALFEGKPSQKLTSRFRKRWKRLQNERLVWLNGR